MTTDALRYRIVGVSDLTADQITRMLELMKAFYQAQEEQAFRNDLSHKQYIVLLCTGEEIQGFSTVAINPGGTGTDAYNVYFSGDTILHPEYWGTQELVKGFFHLVASLHRAAPRQKLYWFLMSKGHRTYMYLPLFFKKYYPGVPDRVDETLAPLLDRMATMMYGDCWDAQTGIIRLPGDSPMVPDLQEASFKKQGHNEHVDFFLKRNPDFATGAELACLVDLSPENFLPLAERCYRTAENLKTVDLKS